MEIAIGCRFLFDVTTPTHAVVLVEPHLDEEVRVSDARFEVTPDITMASYLDIFGNRCRRMTLPAGPVELTFVASVTDNGEPDIIDVDAPELRPADLPDEALMFLLPSRYCQSDRVADFAFTTFGQVPPGWSRVLAISEWVHDHIAFDYGLASPTFTAVDVLNDGHGVCRDFAHLAVALCRALNIPARYVFGYLPDIAVPDPGVPMDFCAWMEVWVGDRWYTFDPRNHQHRIGRTVIGRGRDAADVAMVTTFGSVALTTMTVIAEEVAYVQLAQLLDDDHSRAAELDHRAVDLTGAREVTYVLRNDVAYEYPAPIRALQHRFVVVPRLRHDDQRRVAHRLRVDGGPATAVKRRRDRFGNPIVDVDAPVVRDRISFSMRAVIHRAHGSVHERSWRPLHSTTTELTTVDDDLRAAAHSIDPRASGEPLASSICDAVHDAMTYRFDATTVRTTAGQAWQGRQGVCQDMAHVMIAMCRARGLAARYVSGHLIGEGASHAWVEVHDEATGRPLAYDPTHGRRTDLRYVTVAVGRDYRDVAPTAGHYRSGPRGTLSVRKAVAIAAIR